MDLDRLCKHLKAVNLTGLLNVKKDKITDDGQEGVILTLWRLRGALKNDKEKDITLIVDPDGPGGDLFFIARGLAECEAYDKVMTVYMDANHQCFHGAHRWSPKDNEVHFSFALPIPAGADDFPDQDLVKRLVTDMYEGLLFPELRLLMQAVDKDEVDGEEDKKKKIQKITALYRSLTSSKSEGPSGSDESV
ncbi:MAG: hypothetical protein WCN95_14020 [bacterium]